MASGTSTARAVAGVVLMRDSFEALIRGAREATFVLGNTARLSKLFLAKSMYVYLLIVATNMLGLDFPFLPRQGSVTSLFSLGIPAIFISISVPPPNAGRDFTRNVLRWAIPAAVALAASAMVVHFLVQGVFGRDIEVARTLVSLIIGITAIVFVVEVLGFEGATWRSITRPLMTSILGAMLILGLVASVYFEPLRNFFDFVELGPGSWVIITVAVLAALVGQYIFARHWQAIIDFLIARPSEAEELRGRAV
jgi:cation-transporting P-type ATPase E